jgi:hypothetical protein
MNVIALVSLIIIYAPLQAQYQRGNVAASVQSFLPGNASIELDTVFSLRHGPFHGHVVLISKIEIDSSNKAGLDSSKSKELLIIESLPNGALQIVGTNSTIVSERDDDFILADSSGDLLIHTASGRASMRAAPEYRFRFNPSRHQFQLVALDFYATYSNPGDTEIGFEDYHANYLTHKSRIEWLGQSKPSLKKPRMIHKLLTFDELDSDDKLFALRPPEW